MSIYNYADIKSVHLEVTSKCNALCPMCARSVYGAKVNPNLQLTELSLKDIKKIFPTDFVSQLDKILLNGNYGDPAMASELLEIVSWFRSINENIDLQMYTNGGVRSVSWWKELASLVSRENSHVTFGIDGLEDTNHIYRVNVNWNRLMSNATSFIQSGGNAVWQFIVFRHNQHQKEEAHALSEALGFKRFVLKETERFVARNVHGKEVRALPVYDHNRKFSYFLEEPSKDLSEPRYDQYAKELRGSGAKMDIDITPSMDRRQKAPAGCSLNKNSGGKVVSCIAQKEKSVFVNHLGHVYPCCWTAWPYHGFWPDPWAREIRAVVDQSGGEGKINAKEEALRDIVDGEFFDVVGRGISKQDSLPSLGACNLACGAIGGNGNRDGSL